MLLKECANLVSVVLKTALRTMYVEKENSWADENCILLGAKKAAGKKQWEWAAVETCTLCGELHAGEEMEGTNNVLKRVEAYK